MMKSNVQNVFNTLNNAGADYFVVGGLALLAHGVVRQTLDIDIAINLEPENVAVVIDALAGLGYRSLLPVNPKELGIREIREAWINEKHMKAFHLVSDDRTMPRIDLMATLPFDYQEEVPRLKLVEMKNGQSIRVVSMRTLIEMKEKAGRPKDLDDVRKLRRLLEITGG